jgi:ABC-type transport system substrate-binding protein
MDRRTNYWTRPIRRRRVLASAGTGVAGAAAFGLVGCGGDDDDASTPTSAAGGETATSPAGTTPTHAAASPTSAAASQRGGITVTQSTNVYETVDPHRTVASPVLQVLGGSLSKILRFTNPNVGELTGDLAESWETPDPETVILNIRQNVKWHAYGPGAENPAAAGGRDLTPEDIIYNIERQKSGLLADGSESSFGRKSYWSKVDSATVAGNAITLKLTDPDATFIQGMANEFNQIVQRELMEAVEGQATEISADKVIGTGPFILTEWVPGRTISAPRNPDYFLEDRPNLEGQRWVQTFEDPTAYRIAFEQKQVDSFSDPNPQTTIAIWEGNKDASSIRYTGTANTVAIYLPRAQAPWNDDRLIKAIHLAADRRQLIQQLHNGLGRVSGPVSWLQEAWAIPQEDMESVPGYRLDKTEDLTEAKALWDAAGGADIGDVTFVVPETWAARAGWGASPELMATMFNNAFGTTQFTGRTKSYGEIIPAWQSKNFDPFFGWIPNVEIPDARADMVGAFLSTSPGNFWNVNEPDQIDAKLLQALEMLDVDEAVALLREVQDFVLENGQYGRIVMYNYIAPFVRWNYFRDTGPSDEEGWNFLASSLAPLENWIDTEDPSYVGRAEPSITGF